MPDLDAPVFGAERPAYATTLARVTAKCDEHQELTAAALRRREYRLRHGGKVCSKCEQLQSLAEFARSADKVDWLKRQCRPCDAARYAA